MGNGDKVRRRSGRFPRMGSRPNADKRPRPCDSRHPNTNRHIYPLLRPAITAPRYLLPLITPSTSTDQCDIPGCDKQTSRIQPFRPWWMARGTDCGLLPNSCMCTRPQECSLWTRGAVGHAPAPRKRPGPPPADDAADHLPEITALSKDPARCRPTRTSNRFLYFVFKRLYAELFVFRASLVFCFFFAELKLYAWKKLI